MNYEFRIHNYLCNLVIAQQYLEIQLGCGLNSYWFLCHGWKTSSLRVRCSFNSQEYYPQMSLPFRSGHMSDVTAHHTYCNREHNYFDFLLHLRVSFPSPCCPCNLQIRNSQTGYRSMMTLRTTTKSAICYVPHILLQWLNSHGELYSRTRETSSQGH